MTQTTLPSINDCKSLDEVHRQSVAITKMATDLLNEPIVQSGYQLSGRNGAMAYLNVMSMAKSRLRCLFPTADWRDPLFERLLAESKMIAAECIHLKYECRERRCPYDHLEDCTERIKKLVRDKFNDYQNTIKQLTNEV